MRDVSTAVASAVAVLVSAGLAASCGIGELTTADPPGIAVRDSAGVEIVEVGGAYLDDLPLWRIGVEPIVSIGEVEGEEPYVFAGMGRAGIEAFDDGSLAIVDGAGPRGSHEIRIFDREGRFVRRFGRAGNGPGEFASLPGIRRHSGGGLVALESSQRRVTVFDREGTLIESWRLENAPCPETPCMVRGALGDGTVLLHSSQRPLTVRPEMAGQTFEGLSAFYGISTREGYREVATRPLPTLTVLTRNTTPTTTETGLTFQLTPAMAVAPRLAPSPESAVIAGQDHFAVASHDPFEFRIFDRHGTLIRILRVLRPPTPLTADEQRAVLASTPENVRFQGETVTPHRPEFGYVRFGAGDDLWVPDYRSVTLGDAEAPERITLFGVDGRPVARLEVPPDPIYRDQRRAVLSEVRSDRNHFRIVTADALGIERLLVFEILK